MALRTRIKICGITQQEHAAFAARLGADALGFVFYPPSPRAVDVSSAAQIIASLPPLLTTVALFVDPSPELVDQVVREAKVDLLQFHGDESESFCSQFNKPYIKAVRIDSKDCAQLARQNYASARGFLWDASIAGAHGGTGQAFDWSLLSEQDAHNGILAGGLNSTNVIDAIRQIQPYAVDVSSGVELTRGLKDQTLIEEFIQAVASAPGLESGRKI